MEESTIHNNDDDALNKSEELKAELVKHFSDNDPLYALLKGSDYEIISPDILQLDPRKRYTTNEVAEILQQYTYLYDPVSGTSPVSDPSRLRWWLLKKDQDNLLDYLSVEKTGKNWTWDIYAIVRAKIVSILRYVHNYTQKEIKVFATGISPKTTARISPENIRSLIETGELHNIQGFDLLKETLIQYILYSEERIKELRDDFGNSIDLFGKEFNNYRQEQEKRISTLTQSDLETRRRQHTFELRLKKLQMTRLLKIEAEQAWANRGILKNIMSSKEAKKEFIDEFVNNGLRELEAEEEQYMAEVNQKLSEISNTQNTHPVNKVTHNIINVDNVATDK